VKFGFGVETERQVQNAPDPGGPQDSEREGSKKSKGGKIQGKIGGGNREKIKNEPAKKNKSPPYGKEKVGGLVETVRWGSKRLTVPESAGGRRGDGGKKRSG